MDFSAIKPRTLSLDLVHPGTGAPLGITLELAAPSSDAVMEEIFKLRDENRARIFGEASAKELDANAARMLAASIVGWVFEKGNALKVDGDLPLTMANRLELVSNREIRKQIDAKLANDAAFFDGPETA